VARRAETFQAGVPNIRVHDQNGNRVREAAVWFPESQRILIYSVAINPSGQIVAGELRDLQKGQIGSYLPRSTFSRNPPDVHAQIQCSAEGITVYSLSADTYVEMKYGEAAPHVYGVAAPPQMKLLGFATTSHEQVYGYFSQGDFGGLYYLAFDVSGKPVSWHPVKGAVGPSNGLGVVSGLWGAEGDELFVSRWDDSVGVQAIHWTRVVNR
jgi:hypothetical protein